MAPSACREVLPLSHLAPTESQFSWTEHLAKTSFHSGSYQVTLSKNALRRSSGVLEAVLLQSVVQVVHCTSYLEEVK